MVSGPLPKDPSKRVRGNRKPTIAPTIIRCEYVEQPDLPDDVGWPEATKRWWKSLADSPELEHLTVANWLDLFDTALCHADVWGTGNLNRLAELRTRLDRFGLTPAARARLRIQFAEADAADLARPQMEDANRPQYGSAKLSAVKGGKAG